MNDSRLLRVLVRSLLRLYPNDVPGVERADIETTFFDRYRTEQAAKRTGNGRPILSHILFTTRELWTLLHSGVAARIEAGHRPRPLVGFVDDMGFAVRSLIKNRAFSIGAVAILALGIGVNVAIFSLSTGMSRVVQRFKDPERLAFLWGVEEGWDRSWVSGLDYLEWKDEATAFSDMGVYRTSTQFVAGDGEPQRIYAVHASANLLPMLGLGTEIGRLFGPADLDPVSPRVAVLTHRMWIERYNGEREILGRTVSLNDIPYTVIGVLPVTVEFEILWREAAVFTPLVLNPIELTWDDRRYQVIGRLTDDANMEQAQTQLTTIAARLAAAHPETNAEAGARVEPFESFFYSNDDKLAMALAMAAAVAVLLIACVNLANILLAKGTARQGEIAIRLAVGASRWRLIRQLLFESFFLSFAGGAAGIYLGHLSMRLLVSASPHNPFLLEEVGMDGALLTFVVAVSVAAALAFGLAPALLATRASLAEGLKESMAGASSGRSRKRFRSWLLVAQLALTVPLVLTCAIAYLNVRALEQVDAGFPKNGLLTLQADLPLHRYPDPAQQSAFYRDAVEAVKRIPGVESASFGTSFPIGAGRGGVFSPLVAQGHETEEGRARGPSGFQSVSPEYFAALGVPLLSGRGFTFGDGPTNPQVAVVNQAFTRLYWPGEDALGKQLTPIPLSSSEAGTLDPVTVVGVVADFGLTFYGDPPTAEVYRPVSQQPITGMVLIARATSDPATVFPLVRDVFRRLDPGVPLSQFRTIERIVDEWLNETRVIAVTLGLLGVLALGLAVMGLYGMVAYSVAQRTFELGVRMVLGADRHAISFAVTRSFLLLSSIGLLGGLAISAILGAVMRSQLVMLQVSWIPSVVGIVVLLAMVVLLASYLPARRATTIEPAVALRCE